MNKQADYYAILGIPPEADFEVLKRAYYRRAKECHPDLFGGDAAKEEEFKRLVEAFNILSDPLTRRRYDRHRRPQPEAADLAPPPADDGPEEDGAILDRRADDILEELIVGNVMPLGTTLATLMLDLERTEHFCRFREAKTAFHNRDFHTARRLFGICVDRSPENILAHYYLARCQMHFGRWGAAERHLRRALKIGRRRRPPLRLARLRRELDSLCVQHRGLWSRLRNALAGPPPELLDDPEERMRRQLGRSIDQLARQPSRRRRQLGDGSPRRP